MNAFRLLLASALGVALACALDDELENADCLSNADCWTNQECVRTPMQTAGIPGLCRAKGDGCAEGEQLGCACAVDAAGNRTCTGLDLMPDEPTEETCLCVSLGSSTST